MCGIIGIVGTSDVTPRLVTSLKRLEYRGYDSAGVATVESGKLDRRRAAGKITNLDDLLLASPLKGMTGIGHTRWATHGEPNERNAHPHRSGGVAVVHNGIIENYAYLKEVMASKGTVFETDTDTEVVAVLLDDAIRSGKSPKDAVAGMLSEIRGAYALAMIFESDPDLLIGARKGSPLVIGIGQGEMFLGSDAIALAPFTRQVVYLEEGDWCVLHKASYCIFDETGTSVSRAVQTVNVEEDGADKGNYPHFMLKEIFEQPKTIARTLQAYTHPVHGTIGLPREAEVLIDFDRVSTIHMISCGTAHYATRVAEYWFEQIAGIPCKTDIASEFRYREPALAPGCVAMFVSQSGETADTLAALRYCKAKGIKTIAVVNVKTSTIAREADLVLPTLAGPEIGVASTKAFTSQLVALLATALAAARTRNRLNADGLKSLSNELLGLSDLVELALQTDDEIKASVSILKDATDAFYLGRGVYYPLALEGALKLKEISYIHAEGFASGELKHGPIALITEDTPIIFVAPDDALFEKSLSNLQEVAARRGPVLLISDESGIKSAGAAPTASLKMPECHAINAPVVYAIALQLVAYHAAVQRGTDVDQPRNLAKSVTVE